MIASTSACTHGPAVHHWLHRLRDAQRMRVLCPVCGADLTVERTCPRGVVIFTVYRRGASRADSEFALFGNQIHERIGSIDDLPRADPRHYSQTWDTEEDTERRQYE